MGTQVAVIRPPVTEATKAKNVGILKLSWLVCRLSILQPPEVCFKCFGKSHRTWKCNGADRSNLCRKCGTKGHRARTQMSMHKRSIKAAKTEVKQLNINHCDAAQQLLWQSASETKTIRIGNVEAMAHRNQIRVREDEALGQRPSSSQEATKAKPRTIRRRIQIRERKVAKTKYRSSQRRVSEAESGNSRSLTRINMNQEDPNARKN